MGFDGVCFTKNFFTTNGESAEWIKTLQAIFKGFLPNGFKKEEFKEADIIRYLSVLFPFSSVDRSISFYLPENGDFLFSLCSAIYKQKKDGEDTASLYTVKFKIYGTESEIKKCVNLPGGLDSIGDTSYDLYSSFSDDGSDIPDSPDQCKQVDVCIDHFFCAWITMLYNWNSGFGVFGILNTEISMIPSSVRTALLGFDKSLWSDEVLKKFPKNSGENSSPSYTVDDLRDIIIDADGIATFYVIDDVVDRPTTINARPDGPCSRSTQKILDLFTGIAQGDSLEREPAFILILAKQMLAKALHNNHINVDFGDEKKDMQKGKDCYPFSFYMNLLLNNLVKTYQLQYPFIEDCNKEFALFYQYNCNELSVINQLTYELKELLSDLFNKRRRLTSDEETAIFCAKEEVRDTYRYVQYYMENSPNLAWTEKFTETVEVDDYIQLISGPETAVTCDFRIDHLEALNGFFKFHPFSGISNDEFVCVIFERTHDVHFTMTATIAKLVEEEPKLLTVYNEYYLVLDNVLCIHKILLTLIKNISYSRLARSTSNYFRKVPLFPTFFSMFCGTQEVFSKYNKGKTTIDLEERWKEQQISGKTRFMYYYTINLPSDEQFRYSSMRQVLLAIAPILFCQRTYPILNIDDPIFAAYTILPVIISFWCNITNLVDAFVMACVNRTSNRDPKKPVGTDLFTMLASFFYLRTPHYITTSGFNLILSLINKGNEVSQQIQERFPDLVEFLKILSIENAAAVSVSTGERRICLDVMHRPAYRHLWESTTCKNGSCYGCSNKDVNFCDRRALPWVSMYLLLMDKCIENSGPLGPCPSDDYSLSRTLALSIFCPINFKNKGRQRKVMRCDEELLRNYTEQMTRKAMTEFEKESCYYVSNAPQDEPSSLFLAFLEILEIASYSSVADIGKRDWKIPETYLHLFHDVFQNSLFQDNRLFATSLLSDGQTRNATGKVMTCADTLFVLERPSWHADEVYTAEQLEYNANLVLTYYNAVKAYQCADEDGYNLYTSIQNTYNAEKTVGQVVSRLSTTNSHTYSKEISKLAMKTRKKCHNSTAGNNRKQTDKLLKTVCEKIQISFRAQNEREEENLKKVNILKQDLTEFESSRKSKKYQFNNRFFSIRQQRQAYSSSNFDGLSSNRKSYYAPRKNFQKSSPQKSYYQQKQYVDRSNMQQHTESVPNTQMLPPNQNYYDENSDSFSHYQYHQQLLQYQQQLQNQQYQSEQYGGQIPVFQGANHNANYASMDNNHHYTQYPVNCNNERQPRGYGGQRGRNGFRREEYA